MGKWKSDAVSELNHFRLIPFSSDGVDEPNMNSVPLDSYLSCFFLYFLGNLVAVLCLIFEIYMEKMLCFIAIWYEPYQFSH